MPDINALLGVGVGPALAEGTHAGYFSARANREADEEKRRLAVQGDIPAAVKGDTDALGRVIAGAPKEGLVVSTALGKMEAEHRAKAKDLAEMTARLSHGVLQSDTKDQPAMYDRALEELRAAGHDTSKLGPWGPGTPAMLRFYRSISNEVLKNDLKEELKGKAPGKAGGGGGGGEVWGEPAPGKQSALPTTGPVVAEAPHEPVPALSSGGTGEQGPGGGLPPASPPIAQAPVAPPVGPPQGFQAMGHRDPQGQLVPALIDGKPVYRNPQTGEMQLGEPQVAAAPPAESVPALSSGGTGEQGPGGGLPAGVQMAKLGDRYSPKIVFDNPAERDGVYGTKPGPHGNREPITGPGGGTLYKMPDGTFEEYKPDLKPPKPQKRWEDIRADPNDPKSPIIYQRNPETNELRGVAQRPTPVPGMPTEVADLHGDEFKASDYWKTLSPTIKNNVEGLLDGSLTLSSLAKRSTTGSGGVDFNAYPALAKQIDKTWSPNEGEARKRFENIYMATGQGQQIRSSANTALPHMGTMHDALTALAEGDTSGSTTAGQSVINAARRFFGDPKIATVDTARTLFGPEVAKLVRGGGALNEAEEKAATALSDPKATVQQQQAALITLSDMLGARIKTLEYTARDYGIPETKVKAYISPDARAAMEKVLSHPIPGSQQPSFFERNISPLFGGKTAAPAGGPPPPPPGFRIIQ